MKHLAVLLLVLVLGGCDESMDQQNRTKTYGSSDGLSAWPSSGEALTPPEGTVAQGALAWAQDITKPPDVSAELLARGRARYDIYCAPCHGLTGAGDGMVVARGFPKPKPFDDPALMRAPARDLVNATGSGDGVMYPFSDRVDPTDRWAIVAYLRALQLASHSRATP